MAAQSRQWGVNGAGRAIVFRPLDATATANRQVVGIMVDLGQALEFYVDDTPSLLAISLELAKTPCSPLFKTTVSSDRATVALFGARPLKKGLL